MAHFSVEGLLESARKIAGCNEFGDEEFIPALRQFVGGVNCRDDIIAERIPYIEEDILRLLVNRLWAHQDITQNPEIREEQLQPPVVILGLPRCGTTKLQRILSESGSFQHLLFWQVFMPSRIPGEPGGGKDRRVTEAQRYCDWQSATSPDFQKSHAMSAEAPEEEIFLMNASFTGTQQALGHNAPSYIEWLAGYDQTYTYDQLYEQLQYLQWQFFRSEPRPWLLKTPGHLGNETQLARLFPRGLKIVCPHREPTEVLPSIALLADGAGKLYYNGSDNKPAIGQVVLNLFAAGLHRHMSWRDAANSVEILDLSYRQITQDSMAVAEQVYDFLDQPLTDEHRSRIRAWDYENPQHKHGKASYTLGEFGLSESEVNEVYGDYRNRFSAFL